MVCGEMRVEILLEGGFFLREGCIVGGIMLRFGYV